MGVQKQSTSVQTESHNLDSSTVNLLDGETVITSSRPSLWNWAKPVLVAVGVGLLAVRAAADGEVTAAAVAVSVAGVLGGYAYFARQRSRYVLTDQRVVKSVGLIRTGSDDIRIADVRGVSTKRGVRQRFMRTGTVEISSVGGETAIEMQNFRGYEGFGQAVRRQQQTVEETIGAGSVSVSLEDERYE